MSFSSQFHKVTSAIQNTIVGASRWLSDTKNLVSRFGRPSMGNLGVTGTEICGSYLSEEYLGALQDLHTRCDTFDQIEKSCPAARLALLCCKQPILAASWNFTINEKLCEENGISEKQAEEMTRFVEQNVTESPRGKFKKRINEHLEFLKYGFSIAEIIWRVEGNQVLIDNLEFRHPRTVLWNFDSQNVLQGISQTNYFGQKTAKPIARDKMLIFAQEDIGDNFEGVSTLRYAYRPYKEYDVTKRLIIIALQKFAVGAPILKPESDIRVGDQADLENFIKYWNSHDKNGGILPFGWGVDIFEAKMNGAIVAMKFKESLDQEIFMAAMAVHLLPILKGSGSLALEQEASDFFGMALQSIADVIADVYNYELIPRLIDYNFNSTVYPEVEITIKEEDLQQFIENVCKVTGAGVIPVYQQLQEQIAGKMDLPEVDFKQIQEQKDAEREKFEKRRIEDDKEREEKKKKKDKEKPQGGGKTEKRAGEVGRGIHNVSLASEKKWIPWRDLNSREEEIGGVEYLAERSKFFDKQQKGFESDVAPIVRKQVNQTLSFAMKNRDNAAVIMGYKVPLENEYRKQVEKHLTECAMEGINSVAKEAGREVPDEARKALKSWAKNQAAILAKREADDLLFFVAQKTSAAQLGNVGGADEMSDEAKRQFSEMMERRAFSRFLDAFIPRSDLK